MKVAKRILITGACGFIGSNAADYFLKAGNDVRLLDNMSRSTSEANLQWLLGSHEDLEFEKLDVRSFDRISSQVKEFQPDFILHLAAQVAVTDSVRDPRADFEVNAMGTFNILEAARLHSPHSRIVFASTNKVYGKLETLKVTEQETRYAADGILGVSEDYSLDFFSPYGCSKGSADQYVLDYQRIFGLQTASVRQSCIYGPRQFGVEDQGWMAWFAIASKSNRPITIFGDGKQVRDALYVSDLIDLYDRIFQQDSWIGGSYNAGGGLANSLSLLEYVESLSSHLNKKIDLKFSKARPGDQLWFVSDNSKAKRDLGWLPTTNLDEGIKSLLGWLSESASIRKIR